MSQTQPVEEEGRSRWPQVAPRVVFLGLFGLILAVHVVWELQADLPPPWDMAVHELKGWEYLQAFEEGQFLERFAEITTHFPPLYYVQEALILGLFSQTQFLALISNLLGMFLLSYCTFAMAASHMDERAAVGAGLITLLFPFVAWTSRFSLLDGAMAGWVAAAGFCLVRSRWLESRRWSLAFGVACAAGMLTKWTFAIYVLVPVCFALVGSRDLKRSLINLAGAVIVALPLLSFWYWPNFSALANRYPTTDQTSFIPWQADPRHGEPGLATLLGWIYYPRALSSYFLFFPLTLGWAWSAVYCLRKRQEVPQWIHFLWWWWLLGGAALLIFVTPKDPRFAIPLAPPLAILLMYPWRARPRWVLGILVVAFLQFLSISFDSPLHPVKVALFERHDTDYQSLQREWVLYESHYFNVAGPPLRENWHHQEIVNEIGDSTIVGFVPDLPHLHTVAIQLQAVRAGRSFEVRRIGDIASSVPAVSLLDFVVSKTGFQGISYTTGFNDAVYRELEKQDWALVKTWDLPDESRAQLWRNPRGSP